MPRLHLVFLLNALAVAAFAQTNLSPDDVRLRYGVKLGVQALDSFRTVPGFNAEESRFVIGGLADLRINDYFGGEFNVLYRRFRFDALIPSTPFEQSVLSTNRATALDFPLLLKWRPLGYRDVAPFVDSGVAFRYINGKETQRFFTGEDRQQEFSDSFAQDSSFNVGWVVGAGVDFNRSGGVRITPEIRYTLWGRENFRAASTVSGSAGIFRSQKDQLEFLLGITF